MSRQADVVATLSGSARTLLTGERVMLNLLGRLSGIATATAAVVRAVEGTGVAIKDTRKTTAGLRALEKYAVAVGGGVNHRFGLYDAVLIKDNHIGVAGSIAGAVDRVRARRGDGPPGPGRGRHARPARAGAGLRRRIRAARQHGAGHACAAQSRSRSGRCHLEASGGITLANVRAVAETGVDSISLGWLTHSARSLDLGLDVA